MGGVSRTPIRPATHDDPGTTSSLDLIERIARAETAFIVSAVHLDRLVVDPSKSVHVKEDASATRHPVTNSVPGFGGSGGGGLDERALTGEPRQECSRRILFPG